MTPIVLSPWDLLLASGLIVLSAALSLALSLGFARSLVVAAVRMVVQLMLVGTVLLVVFRLNSPPLTLGVIALMLGAATFEAGSRQKDRLHPLWHYGIGGGAVAVATIVISVLGLTTALRPHPWYDARAAIPLTGIVLGNVMNAGSLALNALLSTMRRDQAAIEARLMLGATRRVAFAGPVRQAIRAALIPTINSMAAAGIVTMPGIMTGQLLAGMSPVAASKYQILLMFMIAGGNCLGAVLCTLLAALHLSDERERLRLDRLLGPNGRRG